VLAIGVDNMFILANALGREDPAVPLRDRVGLSLAAAGPSISLAAACEIVAFLLGSLSPMPAIRNFSLTAALAIAFDFLLQVRAAICGGDCTGFVALC
jgi:Niemann-Pick C1 protein